MPLYRIDVFDKFFVKSFRHTDDDLSPREKMLLERYGTKYQMLVKGTLPARTEDERHFLEVCNGTAKPTKRAESAWLKYQALLKEEEENLRLKQLENPAGREMTVRWGGENLSEPPVVLTNQDIQSSDRWRKCHSCRGTGEQGNGFNCDSCGGRGWIEKE